MSIKLRRTIRGAIYELLTAAFISKYQVKWCLKLGEFIMDDAQCRENIKAWGCAIIVNGTKQTNLKWWANINRQSGY